MAGVPEILSQFLSDVKSATAIAGQVLNGMSPSDFAASLMAASLERADVLLAMVFLGGAIGAGCWIGWELAKFSFGLIKSAIKLSTGRSNAQQKRQPG